MADSEHLVRLRMLDLSRNWRGGGVRPLVWSGLVGRLRSLDLSHMRLDDRAVRVLTAKWDGLVELKLDHNQLTGVGGRHLLDRARRRSWPRLSLRGNAFSDGLTRQLRDHFGERVVL